MTSQRSLLPSESDPEPNPHVVHAIVVPAVERRWQPRCRDLLVPVSHVERERPALEHNTTPHTKHRLGSIEVSESGFDDLIGGAAEPLDLRTQSRESECRFPVR